MPDAADFAPTLRPAGLADAPAMAAILNGIIAEGDKTAIPGPVTEADIARYYLTGPDCRGCTLALIDGRPVGFQALASHYLLAHPGWADIGSFIAAPARGTGTGRALWAATRVLARSRGVPRLRAVIRSVNTGALAYYRACGFARPAVTLPAVTLPDDIDIPLPDRTVLFCDL